MAIKAEFYWNKPVDELCYEVTGGDDGRLFLANEVRRLSDPYVPSSQMGILRGSTKCYVKDGDGWIEYNTPYAHYQYEGILYVSSVTGSSWASAGEYKIKTDQKLNYTKDFHPLATDHWDKAMYVANKNRLLRSYAKYIGAKA